ncbi:hypothetical protein ACFOOK_25045 [Micromonospora krabiensis]|uniref:Uncharacterized protein n=1 Tax=Micromonospora krabiensis TaxID=307121 RepID=A0A1C3N6H2_9ACTN|nr:hypothetical protein [Micromonospora krabiensis]SBV28170.1 hypothetical protein GA0070620_3704 [Micromonospora krabiensis]
MSGNPRRSDNLTDAPTRPFHVTQDELERAVRESFSRQVAVPRPPAVDPAGVAIRRARRVQRRRTVTGLAMAAVATVAVSTGIAQLTVDQNRPTRPTVVLGDPNASGRPDALPSEPAGPLGPPAGVDMIVGDVLTSANGQRVPLVGVGPAERAQRLPDNAGWLVVGAPTTAGRTLWAVSPKGVVQVLLAGAEAIVVSGDGRAVAWRDGDELFAAGVVSAQLIAPVGTPAPATARLVGFVGDAVLVRLTADRPGHVLWSPGAELRTERADRKSLHLYGVLPDGRVVAQLAADNSSRPCLALLDPSQGLDPVSTGCGPNLSGDGLGAVSTDGRWLLVNGEQGRTASALLVDLERLGSEAVETAHPAGPPVTGAVIWTSEEDAAYVDAAGQLIRLRVENVVGGGRAEAHPVPAAGPTNPPVIVSRS